MSKKTKRNWCIFVSRGGLSYESAGLYVYVVMFQTSPLCLRSATVFSTNIHNTLFPVCSVSDHHHTVSYRHTFIIRRRTDMKNRFFFFLKIWLFLCFTFIFNIFYVSTINRKFTSMDAGSWRTSRWRPFYSSVPRSTYSSFTDVLKSRVNTYLINT